MMKKLAALFLALVMVLSVSAAAMATNLDANGEKNPFSEKDTPIVVSDKKLILEKELKVYNLDEKKVNAPTITYNYAIAPATVAAGTTVTDNASKHTSNESVTAPVKAGVGSFSATVSWANEELDADTNGIKNVKNIEIDFSSVVFTGAGVYRYVITETLADGFTYDNTGVTETTGTNTRFIDVYVKPSTTFTDGSTAAEWDIYGFTCFYNNESITDSDKTNVAVKTTGFVDGTNDGTTAILADQYYTYNLTISKTVVNDNYAKATHEFPFTVIFTNGDVTKSILLKTTVADGKATDFTHAAGAPTWSGIALLKDSGSIKYIGIPMGTDVEVYETNDVTGATYAVTTTRTNATTATGTDAMVTDGSKPSTAVSQPAEKPAYQSTKSVIDTTKNADDDNVHTIAITNTLVTISPTGVVLRIAPYALILGAGIALLLISRRRKMKAEEE